MLYYVKAPYIYIILTEKDFTEIKKAAFSGSFFISLQNI